MFIKDKKIVKITFDDTDKVFEFFTINGELIITIPDHVLSVLINDTVLDIIDANISEVELAKRAYDRIAILRGINLDPKIEFDTVPAYLRRNVNLDKGVKYYYAGGGASEGFHEDIRVGENDLPDDYSEPVFIFLPAKEIIIFEAEILTNACGDFMEALDYELEVENEPILGSYIQNLWFKIKKGTKVSRNEIAQDFAKGKKALELKYVELPTAEQTEKLANSAAKIVEFLDKQDEGIVRLGALIVLKKQVDGKPKIIVQQLNFDLISLFDKTPQLLLNLQTAYEVLTGDVKGAKRLDETGTETLSQ